ncbi:hypothetical protein [Saccharopolyspora sp. 5N708]|uniref:hypothetical protein n=1 Tax=Saccharopolyspora sp. 5N708 TaxID=3457424 RepID=UPI003FD51CA6
MAAAVVLFHDCSPQRAELAISLPRPSNPVIGGQGVRAAAWRRIPTTFVRGALDRMPELVTAAMPWAAVDTVELPSGHCPKTGPGPTWSPPCWPIWRERPNDGRRSYVLRVAADSRHTHDHWPGRSAPRGATPRSRSTWVRAIR